MSYTYAQRKKADAKTPAAQNTPPARVAALARGAVKPSAAEMGHRVDLPEAMRAKMESSFGADLSAVRLYESQSVADAGAEAIAQGSNIAFAPGKLDLTSSGGQALLGHELSHVVSQARGEVTGGGFLNDHALEARADREGAMAARGESVADAYGGAVAPLSAASAAPAAGPMQAKRGGKKERTQADYSDDAKSLIDLSVKQQKGEKLSKKEQKFMSANTGKFDPMMMDAMLQWRDQASDTILRGNGDEEYANWMTNANSLYRGMMSAGTEEEQHQFSDARNHLGWQEGKYDDARKKFRM